MEGVWMHSAYSKVSYVILDGLSCFMFVFQEANSGASCAVIQEGVEVVIAINGWIGIFAPEVHMCYVTWFGKRLL